MTRRVLAAVGAAAKYAALCAAFYGAGLYVTWRWA
jgi:hypothetical protein